MGVTHDPTVSAFPVFTKRNAATSPTATHVAAGTSQGRTNLSSLEIMFSVLRTKMNELEYMPAGRLRNRAAVMRPISDTFVFNVAARATAGHIDASLRLELQDFKEASHTRLAFEEFVGHLIDSCIGR